MNHIKVATFGDEHGARDVTESIAKHISGGKVDIAANSSLIPLFEVSREIELTQEEKKEVRDEAAKQCAGGADTKCMEAETGRLTRNRVQDKMTEQQTTANTVKGRRLTVTIVDDKGKEKQVIVPDGQQFKYEGLVGKVAPPGSSASSSWSMPSFSTVLFQGLGSTAYYSAIAAIILLWCIGLFITIQYFRGWGWVALIPVLMTVTIPGAGLVLVFIAEVLRRFSTPQ